MKILNQKSLSETINNLNQVFLDNIKIPTVEKKQIAKWISGRQGLPGSYWNMFAPTPIDYKGIKLFTGEDITTRAGISHILGEESCRALYMLNIKDSFDAVDRAQTGLKLAINNAKEKGYESNGYFCCGKCTVAYWRNLSAEDIDKNSKLLRAGLKILKSYRDGKGKWGKFPFYYTLYSLSGIELPEAKEELKYASDVFERLIRTMRKEVKYAERRFKLIEKVLSIM